MKKIVASPGTTGYVLSIIILCIAVAVRAQEPDPKRLSVGLNLGDPLGASLKYKVSSNNAFAFGFGPDYFGSPRLQVDYIRQFDTFKSNTVKSYVGPGLAVAFAKGSHMFFSREPKSEWFADKEDKGVGVGGRAIFGLNYAPIASPFEFFVEAGPLVAFTKIFDLDIDGAFGVRFYP